jgi:hypothetical protein
MTKNKTNLACPKCKCVVFAVSKAFKQKNTSKIVLNPIKKDVEEGTIPEEIWTCSSMMDFENIGFSKPVDGIKFLVCADCELGPLGFHDPTELPLTFNIAHDRVVPI